MAWLAHDRTSCGRLFQKVGEETEKASEAKSDLTNGMTSKAPVEDLNVLTSKEDHNIPVLRRVCLLDMPRTASKQFIRQMK